MLHQQLEDDKTNHEVLLTETQRKWVRILEDSIRKPRKKTPRPKASAQELNENIFLTRFREMKQQGLGSWGKGKGGGGRELGQGAGQGATATRRKRRQGDSGIGKRVMW